jgi:transposase
MSRSATNFAAFIGLDRSDAKLDLCLQVPGAGRPEHSTLDNTPEQIASWLETLRTRFAGQPVALCLEQPAGGLLHHLLGYDFVVLYAINPMSLARHRETLVTSRAKSDKSDAYYLMDLVHHYHDQLTAYVPDEGPLRALAALVQARRAAVDLRTQLTNRLKAHLKSYYPQALCLAGDELYTTLACDFLLRWPSLQALKRARAATLRQFYIEHNSRRREVIAERLELIQKSVPLHNDTAVLPAAVLTTRLLAGQLKQLVASIAEFEARIEELFSNHEDAFIFASLPGAGAVHSARLLAALGSDREKFADAAAVQKYSGIAPIIKESGNTRRVQRRLARPKFIHQSFVEYAHQSLKHCTWAKAFYDLQRQKGKRHYAAVRALAFKWIRIIFKCWQERVAYEESRYVESLRRSRSPLWVALSPTAASQV